MYENHEDDVHSLVHSREKKNKLAEKNAQSDSLKS